MRKSFFASLVLATITLSSAFAAGPSVQTKITQEANGRFQTFKREDRLIGSDKIYRMVQITRTVIEADAAYCQVTYYGPALDRVTQVVIVQGNKSETHGLGYIPLNGPDFAAVAQGSVPCPGDGEWQGAVAFANSYGEWDSDFGKNFSFRFDGFNL